MSQQDRTTSGRRFVGPPIVSELYDDAEMAELEQLMANIEHAFMSRPDTLVVPGDAMPQAMDLILGPRIRAIIEARKSAP